MAARRPRETGGGDVTDPRVEELERLLVIAVRTGGCAVSTWQCSGCGHAFSGRWRHVCPSCKREGYLTGSVDAAGRAQLAAEPLMQAVARIREIVARREAATP